MPKNCENVEIIKVPCKNSYSNHQQIFPRY